ncbi:WD-40 repeat protein [Beggiatoa sp. PS]|nr:WD-40 repeat protein [Beggiatoa sp. PS]
MNTNNYNFNLPLQLFSKTLKIILIFGFGLLLTNVIVLADTVTKPIRTFQGHTYYVESVAFMPDGKTILSGSLDNTLKLWDIETGQEINSLSGHTGWIMSVVALKKDNTFLSASYDKTLKLWNSQTGQEIHTFEGHTRSIFSVALSPNGKTALSGSGDNTLILWGLNSKRKLRTFKGHTNVITSVAFSPNGKMALSGSYDKTLKLWNIRNRQVMKTFEGHTDKIWSVAFSPDGLTCLSGSEDKTIKRWNLKKGIEINEFQGHTDKVWSVAFSPDGKTIVSGSEDNTIRLWNSETEQEIRTFQGHNGPVRSVTFSPDGHYILSGSTDNTLKLWRTQNAIPKPDFIVFPHKGPAPLIVNLDGSLSTDADGTIINYNWQASNDYAISTVTPTATMTFSQPGTYTINLVVTDNANETSTTMAQQTVTVKIPNIPPTASFTATPTMGKIPLTVTFDATGSIDADGSIVNYEWAINGQLVKSGNPATHTFTAFDEYLVQLTVTDNKGITETVQKNIKIIPPNQAPVALFTTTPAVGQAPLTVILNAQDSFDPDPSGEIVNYEWNVNGQKLVGMMASTLLTVVGEYAVVLTITDNQGATAQIQKSVNVTTPNQAPIADFTATPLTGTVPLTVTLEASSSIDPDGSIVNYQWNANEQLLAYGNPTTHTFTESGEHIITLTVTDNQGTSAEFQKMVNVISSNQVPIAHFTATPSTGQIPLTITLDATKSMDADGSIVNYQWMMNDQLLAYGNPTTHTLTEIGDYLITLTVTDDKKATATAQQNVRVTPINKAPKAHFTVTPLIGEAPLTISLNASGCFDMDGEVVNYEWTVDGQKLSGVIASVTLNTADEYLIVLTVTDNQGLTAIAQKKHQSNKASDYGVGKTIKYLYCTQAQIKLF